MNNKWWVILEGELFMAVIFEKRAAYDKSVQYPIEGTVGYVIHKHLELEVEFNEMYQVWHGVGQGAEVEGFKEELDARAFACSWSH